MTDPKHVLEKLETAKKGLSPKAAGAVVEAIELGIAIIRELMERHDRPDDTPIPVGWMQGYEAGGQHYRIDTQGRAWSYSVPHKKWVLSSEGP